MWVYKVRCEYKYVETQGICLVYSINGMDFIYDHITDKEKEDPLIVAVASSSCCDVVESASIANSTGEDRGKSCHDDYRQKQ